MREILLARKLLSESAIQKILSPYEMTHPGIAGGKDALAR